MKKNIYKVSLLAGVSVFTLSTFGFVNIAKSHSVSVPPACHTTNADGSAASQSSNTELCPEDIEASYVLTCPEGPNLVRPDTFEGCCFIAGTKVLMADGTAKNIEDITIGDEVIGGGDTVNTVTNCITVTLNDRPLVSINGSKHFATADHTFKSKDGWVSADPELTKKNYKEVIDHIGMTPTALEKGTILLTPEGEVEVSSVAFENDDPETEVYDISLTGNKTFYADNYLVHNGGCGSEPGEICFFAGTKVLMADGTTKNIETIEVGNITAFGMVHQKFAKRYDYAEQVVRKNGCMEYDGIYVTGFHIVKDGDKWVPSYESAKSNPCLPPNNQEQVYNLVTEQRIIPVIGDNGLHYFSDILNNRDGVCEKSLSEHMERMQETA